MEKSEKKLDISIFLGHAIQHLEKHWPDRVGMYATKSFWQNDSYPDYTACQILKAIRDLVRYT